MSAAGSKYIDTEVENAINGVKQMKTLMDKTSKDHRAILHTLEETKRRKEVSEDEEGGRSDPGTRSPWPGWDTPTPDWVHLKGSGDAVPWIRVSREQGDALGAEHGCLAGGGAAGPGEGAAAGGEGGGVQRDDAGALGRVQALPQAHLHALLLPHVPQRLGAGGAAGEWSHSTR